MNYYALLTEEDGYPIGMITIENDRNKFQIEKSIRTRGVKAFNDELDPDSNTLEIVDLNIETEEPVKGSFKVKYQADGEDMTRKINFEENWLY